MYKIEILGSVKMFNFLNKFLQHFLNFRYEFYNFFKSEILTNSTGLPKIDVPGVCRHMYDSKKPGNKCSKKRADI